MQSCFESIMTSAVSQTPQQLPHHQQQPAAVPTPVIGSWYADIAVKSEPMDSSGSSSTGSSNNTTSTTSSSFGQQYLHHLHHHQHHHHHLQQQQQLHHNPQQDTPVSHSSPTSPHSVDSMDSLNGRNQYYETATKLPPNSIMSEYNPLGFNPLTPPGYAGLFVAPPHNLQLQHSQQHPQQQLQQLHHHQQSNQATSRQSTPNRHYSKGDSGYVSSTLTPTHTPPMDETPPKSPKEDVTRTPEKHDDDHGVPSDCEESYDGSEDEEGIRKPKVNSHGKIKKFKCKQCEFVAFTKLDFWEHTRNHIKPEKMLTCPKCPFVTEYKHHLEYHLRNHQRSKPFQCPKCSYSCVNKSMLNSHMKSHSNVFQYRCADCNYATKYCHSLKLHLRKYGHKPDVVLNQDGTPNPLPIIDVYGTRRGPKTKSNKNLEPKPDPAGQQQPAKGPLIPQPQHQPISPNRNPFATLPSNNSSNSNNTPNLSRTLLPHQLLQNPLANMFKTAASTAASGGLPFFPYLNLNLQMFADQQAAMAQLSPNFRQQFANSLNEHFTAKQMAADAAEHREQSPVKSSPCSPADNSLASVPSVVASSTSTPLNGTSLSEELLKQITAAAADSSSLRTPEAESMDHQEIGNDEQSQQQQQQLDTNTPRTPSTTNGVSANQGDRGSTNKNHRRKGRAFKLERLSDFAKALQSLPTDSPTPMTITTNSADEDGDDDDGAPMSLQQHHRRSETPPINQVQPKREKAVVDSAVQTTPYSPPSPPPPPLPPRPSTPVRKFECRYCDIAFRDDVLYTIHMGYHGYDEVFKCNMCGEKSEDRIGFFLHIARKAH